MNVTGGNEQNGTVEVATFLDKTTGKYFLEVVHVASDGTPEIIGMDYANLDEAKSAAWLLAQQLKASVLPTKGRA